MKYSYSHDGETFWGDFDTVEAALKEVFDAETQEAYTATSMGPKKAGEYITDAQIIGLLEDIAVEAYEECGEVAQNFLDGVTRDKDACAVLKEIMRAALNTWADKYGQHPVFGHAENIRHWTQEEAMALLSEPDH